MNNKLSEEAPAVIVHADHRVNLIYLSKTIMITSIIKKMYLPLNVQN